MSAALRRRPSPAVALLAAAAAAALLLGPASAAPALAATPVAAETETAPGHSPSGEEQRSGSAEEGPDESPGEAQDPPVGETGAGDDATVADSPAESPSRTTRERADRGGDRAAPAAEVPLPGQSDQPAPPSGEKRVIENVHTDTVSAFVDDGRLVLDSKADVDGRLGTRFAADATLFHLGDVGRTTVPSNPRFSFLGSPGDTIWLAPQTQNRQIIWPGFSTEDSALRAVAEKQWLKTRLLEVEGPGEVEIYLIGEDVERIFSSTEQRPDWLIEVPQHTHMNWAFTKAGSYTLTFEMEGLVGGETQRAQNRFTFVVGDLAAHTAETTTTLEADLAAIDPGEAITFTATVEPASAGGGATGAAGAGAEPAGAVQFRDTTNDAILGHSPLTGGAARFRTAALPPGERSIVAEFVPTWSNDFGVSSSQQLPVVVRGSQTPKPEGDDTTPLGEDELAAMSAGEGARVTAPEKRVEQGGTVTAQIDEGEARGDWVSVWLYAARPVWLGWAQTGLDGRFAAAVPESIGAGKHRLVVENREDGLIGWDDLEVIERASGGGGAEPPAPPPKRPPAAVPQECLPAVTLDRGHIDAFNVTVGGGRAVLQLKEDVTGHQVIREAETVLLRVKEQARTSIPAGVPGGPSGYLLPLSQNPNLIWPGWDTNRTALSGYTDVSIDVFGVSGPGRVALYTSQGSFGGWRPILTHGGYHLPGIIREPTPAHTHAQWVFSRKGVYVLSVRATATNPSTGRSISTAIHNYVFQVGDVPLGDVFCGLRAHGAADAEFVNAAAQRAGEKAVSAQQSGKAKGEDGGERLRARRDDGEGDLLAALLHGELPPWAAGIVVGGGVLVLAGIAGGTVWLLRRMNEEPSGG